LLIILIKLYLLAWELPLTLVLLPEFVQMSKMSRINVIEKYKEHRFAIHNLLSSIVDCFADEKMLEQSQEDLAGCCVIAFLLPLCQPAFSSGCTRQTDL